MVAAGAGLWFWLAGSPGPGPGQLLIDWRGSFRGQALLPAQIQWCPVTRMATLEAISNDTGLVITLQEDDSLTVGVHPVISPAMREQSPRPGAIASLRWVRDTLEIMGFNSASGLVDVTTTGATASGRAEIRMRRPVGPDTLIMSATFRDLPIVATAAGCS